jgi:RNA polymerase sigma-70 factor, ECF subfamily
MACIRIPQDPESAEALIALVKRGREGELAALNELIVAYQARVAGFVYAMLGRSAPVDDLCQDIFSKMVRSIAGLKDPALFEAWLFRMARNRSIDYARRERWRRLFVPFDPATDDRPMDVDAAQKDRVDALLVLLQRLGAKDRSLLLMAQNGLSLAEMAEATGTNSTTIKTRLHRARERLRKLYEKRA